MLPLLIAGTYSFKNSGWFDTTIDYDINADTICGKIVYFDPDGTVGSIHENPGTSTGHLTCLYTPVDDQTCKVTSAANV